MFDLQPEMCVANNVLKAKLVQSMHLVGWHCVDELKAMY
jgi:hypothetical protein